MRKNSDRMWAQAEEKVLEIIANDEQWNLFVKQAEQHGIDLKNARKRARGSEDYRSFLKMLYIDYSATQICDLCDYNPNHRNGQRKFTSKRIFNCTWTKTQGDVLAEQTAREEGHEEEALYKFNDRRWNARYEDLSKVVLEEHKDRTKAPIWLDVKRNLCPHYYIDLTKP